MIRAKTNHVDSRQYLPALLKRYDNSSGIFKTGRIDGLSAMEISKSSKFGNGQTLMSPKRRRSPHRHQKSSNAFQLLRNGLYNIYCW